MLRGRALRVEVEVDALAGADEPVTAARQSYAIGLKAMPESWLHDAVPELDVADEAMEIGKQVRVEVVDVCGDDRPEEDAAEPGRGIGRQRAVADATRAGVGENGRECQTTSSARTFNRCRSHVWTEQ